MDNDIELLMKLRGKKFSGRIQHWGVYDYFGKDVIRGYIFDSPYKDKDDKYRDGNTIRTSFIERFYNDVSIVETRNSFYILGEKDQDFK
jgi:hypothetical protein